MSVRLDSIVILIVSSVVFFSVRIPIVRNHVGHGFGRNFQLKKSTVTPVPLFSLSYSVLIPEQSFVSYQIGERNLFFPHREGNGGGFLRMSHAERKKKIKHTTAGKRKKYREGLDPSREKNTPPSA